MHNAVYQRIKLLACEHFRLTPREFDAEVEREAFSLEDIIELILYKQSIPVTGENVLPYLFREEYIRRKNKEQAISDEIGFLSLVIKGTDNPEKRRQAEQRLKELSGGNS